MSPTVGRVSVELKDEIKVCKVNVDDASGLARKYKITGIPAFLIFRDGEVVAQEIGGMSKAELTKFVRSAY